MMADETLFEDFFERLVDAHAIREDWLCDVSGSLPGEEAFYTVMRTTVLEGKEVPVVTMFWPSCKPGSEDNPSGCESYREYGGDWRKLISAAHDSIMDVLRTGWGSYPLGNEDHIRTEIPVGCELCNYRITSEFHLAVGQYDHDDEVEIEGYDEDVLDG